MMTCAFVISKALEGKLALEGEVSPLPQHLSFQSKRIHKPDPPRRKVFHADKSPPPGIEGDILQSAAGGQTVDKRRGG